MKNKAFTVDYQLLGNAIIIEIKPMNGYKLAQYGSKSKGNKLEVVLSKYQKS